MYLTALSDTCCALCGSPLPPNPLLCPKQVPLLPLVAFCAPHVSHCVPSPLLCPAEVPLHPHPLSVPQMGPAAPLTPCCALRVVHSTPVPLLHPILPPTVSQTGPMVPLSPTRIPPHPQPLAVPHGGYCLPPSEPYTDLPRGSPLCSPFPLPPPHRHPPLPGRSAPSHRGHRVPPTPHAPRPLALMKWTAVSGPPSSGE